MRKRMVLGLAGRIILAIILLLVLVEIFDWILSDGEPEERASTEIRLANQMIAATTLFDKTPPDERAELAEALTGIALYVELSNTPAKVTEFYKPEGSSDRDALNLLRRTYGEDGFSFGMNKEPLGRWHGALSIALDDGSYVIYRVPAAAFEVDEFEENWLTRGLFWLLILAIVFWAGNRLAKPVRRFASAAERLGKDINAPPLPEKGSRELKRAIRAFNDMQTRIQRMIDDRNLMLAAIAHDLRTVLTRLRLRTEFIEEDTQRDKAAGDIEEMQSMIEASISFAKGESSTEAREPCDLAAMLRDLTSDLGGAEGKVSYEGPETLSYPCGPTEMRRTFRNLIVNALSYGGSAHVRAERLPEAVIIRIEDNGPGIPEDKLENVFRPFYRVETSRNRETGGTGLGLAIAKTVILRHGGDILLANRPEGGLAVTIVLPPAR